MSVAEIETLNKYFMTCLLRLRRFYDLRPTRVQGIRACFFPSSTEMNERKLIEMLNIFLSIGASLVVDLVACQKILRENKFNAHSFVLFF